jgi:putative ABC transport system permease protein
VTKARGRLLKSLRYSFRILAAHRLRTALSVSGLILGVATVIVMAAVGAGAEHRVVERVRAMGTNLLIVTAAPAPLVAGRARQVASMTTLRPADADAIVEEAVRAVAAAAAVIRPVVAHWQGRNVPTTILGTSRAGLGIRNLHPRSGRLFDEVEERERRRVVLLGPSLAHALFGSDDPVGREIRLGGVPMDVIGVLEPRGTDVSGGDLDHVVVTPLETAMRRVLNVSYVHALYVQARSSADLPALEVEVRGILDRRHARRAGTPEPYLIQNQVVLLRTERGATRALSRLIVATATLALLVGGIGVLATMLLSVRERVREIGLRRAVGARERDIHLQFLLESGLLATMGGAAGVTVGVVVAGAAALLGPWDLVLSFSAALLGLVVSAGVGLLAGVVPAVRAGKLQPIEALKGG